MRTVIPQNAQIIPDKAKLVFKGKIFDVYQWDQEMFDGSTQVFERLKRPDTTKVFVVQNEKVIVLQEEQPGGHEFFDLPGGRHDVDSETELQSAQREVREETGLVLKNWKLVDVVQPQSKIDWFVYTFVAWEVETQGSPEVHAGEKIVIKQCDFDEALKLGEDPKARSDFKQLLERAGSVKGLLELPEFVDNKV
ncbi:MAG TPA: NUDIX domain-containing protein [Candidatus Saccharimonadales bacterium]|nr:NUDIX domain-containing protein [Candidatus Saccharimonadales bacterium]